MRAILGLCHIFLICILIQNFNIELIHSTQPKFGTYRLDILLMMVTLSNSMISKLVIKDIQTVIFYLFSWGRC